ncbi:hypothetical protein ACJA88_002436 [Fusarium oxysporum]
MSLILKNIMPQAFGCRDHIQDDNKPAMSSEQTFQRHEIQSARNAVAGTILDRHSTRAFCTGQAVPMSVVEDCFSIAQHAPSSTNIQPWRVTVASVVAVISIDKDLKKGDVLSVGIYLQTLLLLLTEKGLGTQVSAAPTGYPNIIKRELGIDENLDILCTVGIGFENKSQHINSLKMPRDDWKQSVRFVME